MIDERDDDRQDRPRLAQPARQRERGDLGRLVLERLDERRRASWCGIGRSSGGCGLHRTRPYRTGPLVDPLTMVLMALSVGGGRPARSCRPVARGCAGDRLDAAVAADPLHDLGDGVQSRTK